ncbi:MAG: hydantoinase/carbamoylase family amidase, partial [Kineosporiaceae bacterium]
GLTPWQDAAGNQCGRQAGADPDAPALVIGSHLDTVPDAGRYDGPLGVTVALAVADRLRERAGDLPFAVAVVGFAAEEGARFGTALTGSRAFAGSWDPAHLDLPDADGVTMREAYEAFGLDPDRVGDAARRPEELVGYLEAHIEQGVRLDDAGASLGVVTSIAGARRFAVGVLGEARHAGGTPFARRRDALVGASHAVLEVARLAAAAGCVATVGRLHAYPGAFNVVPGRVELSVDVRAEHDDDRDRLWEEIQDSVAARCTGLGLRLVVEEVHAAPACRCDGRLRGALAAGSAAAGAGAAPELLSWAGHDAMAVAAVTPVGMLFVRCADGISHHPAERVDVADVALAIDAMEAAVLDLAQGPGAR